MARAGIVEARLPKPDLRLVGTYLLLCDRGAPGTMPAELVAIGRKILKAGVRRDLRVPWNGDVSVEFRRIDACRLGQVLVRHGADLTGSASAAVPRRYIDLVLGCMRIGARLLLAAQAKRGPKKLTRAQAQARINGEWVGERWARRMKARKHRLTTI